MTLSATARLNIIHDMREKRAKLPVLERVKLALHRGQTTHDDAAHELHKRKCRQSLEYFTKTTWDLVEPGRELVWNWHLTTICEALEKVSRREISRLIINIPPGHMKSLLVSVMWPAWNWLEDPSWAGFFASYSAKLAERDARKCRDLIQHPTYRALIPRVYGQGWDRAWAIKDDTNAVALYENEYRGGRTTTSVGGTGTGFRATDLVIDDPMNAEEHPTMETLQSVIDWYNGRMSSRFRDMSTGAIVIIMQRLHTMDLAGYVLLQDEANEANPAWKRFTSIVLPSEFNPNTASPYDKRTVKGELLFPERFDANVIEEAKLKLGPRAYAAQHDQNPVPASGGLLPMSDVCYYYPKGLPQPPVAIMTVDAAGNLVAAPQMELPDAFDEECLSWDCAFKDTKGSDYVAGQAWGRIGGDFFLLEQELGHFAFTETKDRLRNMAIRRRKAIYKYVEDKANGTAVIDALKRELVGLVAVEPKGGKESRAHSVSPLFRTKHVWLPHPQFAPWIRPYIKELTDFPLGAHDDQVDATTQALMMMSQSSIDYVTAMTNATKTLIGHTPGFRK